jgi:hypothetical protein
MLIVVVFALTAGMLVVESRVAGMLIEVGARCTGEGGGAGLVTVAGEVGVGAAALGTAAGMAPRVALGVAARAAAARCADCAGSGAGTVTAGGVRALGGAPDDIGAASGLSVVAVCAALDEGAFSRV